MGAWGLAALALIAGCGTRSSTITAPTPAALVTRTCGDCHDNPSDPDRPDLRNTISPAVAGRALRALLDDRMPPRTARDRYGRTERRELAGWFCAQTKRSQEACDEVIVAVLEPPRMRTGAAIAGHLTSTGPITKPESFELQQASGNAGRGAAFMTLVLKVTVDLCRRLNPSDIASCTQHAFHEAIREPTLPRE